MPAGATACYLCDRTTRGEEPCTAACVNRELPPRDIPSYHIQGTHRVILVLTTIYKTIIPLHKTYTRPTRREPHIQFRLSQERQLRLRLVSNTIECLVVSVRVGCSPRKTEIRHDEYIAKYFGEDSPRRSHNCVFIVQNNDSIVHFFFVMYIYTYTRADTIIYS